MARAAAQGDLFVTATGNINVIDRDDFAQMKDGAILANAGHFNAEVNLAALTDMAGEGRRKLRPMVEEYKLADDQSVIVLGEGRLINLAAAEGHPASVMDMSFANQAMAAAYLVRERGNLEQRVYQVPMEIDHEIARMKLLSMDIEIDTLTEEQERYLNSWDAGT
jgi:adenosylhomocysteinase